MEVLMTKSISHKTKQIAKNDIFKAKKATKKNIITVLDKQIQPIKFPIVGIGASAGGLAAFEEFFTGMPKDKNTDMAFILVQHLAPDHKSILSDIISRYTRMQVFEVTDGMIVAPNCIYIIPPNHDMALINGTLQLFEQVGSRSKNLPINYFFQSLADDQHDRAICIILSGTGSDGTIGLRHIKAEGGLVIVQNPETTDYDGMPKSAIATGLVDYILSPSDMAQQLITYNSHFHSTKKSTNTVVLPNEINSLKKVFVLVRAQTGHDFSKYKPNTINRRIERRLAVHQIETMENYARFLQQTPAEIDALFHDLLIGVTSFFRDKEAFSFLEKEVIPKLFIEKSAELEIRIWCVGCSTGEEAYSLAILVQECIERSKNNYNVKIFATDIDNNAISIARAGLYSNGIESDLTPERLAKYFKLETGTGFYRISKSIRDMLIFSEQSVIKDPPFSKLDLISCRNLLIYLDSNLQKKVIPLFHYSLKPNGFLFLGGSETIGEFDHLFVPLDRKRKIYLRKEDYHGKEREALNQIIPKGMDIEFQKQKTVFRATPLYKLPLKEITEQAVLKESSIAGILINEKGDILYLHGRTGMYLEPSAGEAAINNIFKMAREGLKHDLTEGFHKVLAGKEKIHLPGISVKTNGHFSKVNVTIKKVLSGLIPLVQRPLYIVLLEEAQIQEPVHTSKAIINQPFDDMNTQLEELQNELRIKEEYLQSTNEELETSNEELKSANEEMQSVNEELQSTNEELETSKEELQSINEELTTINSELQAKVHDLSQINNDMINLLAGTNIATIFLDLKQNILRFTPTATKIVNLIESDIGRPIAHIVSNLRGYNQLPNDVKSVLDTLVTKMIKVQSVEGRWYDMVIQPYRTIENVIEGAVVTFIDITEENIALKKLSVSELSYRTLFETTKEGILVLDGVTGQIKDVNPYLIELLGYSKMEFLEKEIWNIGLFKDIVANKDKFIELQKQKYIRYNNLPLKTVSGNEIEVEFISNAYDIDNIKIIQCNIRKIIKLQD